MRIGFHLLQFGHRGTDVATFDYARYNEEILGNQSVILGTINRPHPALKKFQDRFHTITYTEDWNGTDNSRFQNTLETICKDEHIDVFYTQKGGENDKFLPRNTKSVVHCVFNMRDEHGQVYAGISEYLAKRDNKKLFVPYMVDLPSDKSDLRAQLGVSKDAFIVGRHGGENTFNIGFTNEAVWNIVHQRPDIVFIFLGTNQFCPSHPRIIHLPINTDMNYKRAFINACDAMLHARIDGETFGLACGEFSLCNKPVITYNGPDMLGVYDRCHLDILGDKCIGFANSNEIYTILMNIEKKSIEKINWDAYSEKYNPRTIMNKFKEVFLD
jgi:hypothetical protein